MLFFPLYITAWASSLLLNVNNNNNNNNNNMVPVAEQSAMSCS